jgi:hypothetical protein
MTTSNPDRESAAILRRRMARWIPLEYAGIGFFLAAIALLFLRGYFPRDLSFARNGPIDLPLFEWSSSHGLHVDCAASALVALGAALGWLVGSARARKLQNQDT